MGDGLPRAWAGGCLRRFRDGDLAAFQSYRADPEVGRYQSWSVMDDAQAASFIRAVATMPLYVPGEWSQLAIASADGDALLGDVGLCVAADARSAEIGFTLAPAAQGRGLGTAAVMETARLLFDRTGIACVIGITDSRNTPSVRLMERAGFRFRSESDAVFRGEPCVERTYVLERATLSPR